MNKKLIEDLGGGQVVNQYVIGIDGGGTGTRARVCDASLRRLGDGTAGPSALGQGIEQAWRNVNAAIADAFDKAGLARAEPARCVLGIGLSGVNHAPWRDAFVSQNPGYAHITLNTDAHTALLGAHAGRPGVILISGTGCVGEALYPDGTSAVVGGWGFPSGDEGSGASIGLRATRLAQQVLDGRGDLGPLVDAVLQRTGRSVAELQAWCASAGQFAFATLAPLVFDCEGRDPEAQALLDAAAGELDAHALALDPGGELALVLVGSVAKRLQPRLRASVQARLVEPAGDPLDGALRSAWQGALTDHP
jgi:glucosamine kinase